MTDRTEPALSGEQWAEWRRALAQAHGVVDDTIYNDTVGVNAQECAEIIAYNNDALPDSDPRKITREIVDQLRSTRGEYLDFSTFGDALASYLPPE